MRITISFIHIDDIIKKKKLKSNTNNQKPVNNVLEKPKHVEKPKPLQKPKEIESPKVEIKKNNIF